MDEMLRYIFGELQINKKAMSGIGKIFKYQQRFNKKVVALSCAITTYTILLGIYHREQRMKIEELSDEIKELKREKGE